MTREALSDNEVVIAEDVDFGCERQRCSVCGMRRISASSVSFDGEQWYDFCRECAPTTMIGAFAVLGLPNVKPRTLKPRHKREKVTP